MNYLREFHQSTNSLLNWFLDDRSICLERDGNHRPFEIAQQISSAYNFIDSTHNEVSEVISINPDKFDAMTYTLGEDKSYLNIIDNMASYVKSDFLNYIDCFLLHGSLATKDYSIGWSDVDSFVVLNSKTVRSARLLTEFREKSLELRRLFYDICPLQHHGIMAYTNYDLNNYSSRFLPLEALADTVSIYSKEELTFKKSRILKQEKSPGLKRLKDIFNLTNDALINGEFFHHPYKGVGLKVKYKNHENSMRQFFWFIGTIMTMPAFLLTALNKPTLKKKSFDLVKGIYSDRSLELINDATRVRNLWGVNEGVFYKGNSIPTWLRDNFSEDYMQRFRDLLKDSIDIIESDSFCDH